MAERPSGPVKPPTIDLVARDATVPQPPPPRPEAAAPSPDLLSAPPPVTETPAETPASPAPPPPADEATVGATRRTRARKTAAKAAEPEAPPEPVQPPPPPPPPPAPQIVHVRSGPDWMQIGAAAVIGALFGTALTYVVATIVPMPSRTPAFADPTPAIADQATALDGLGQRLQVLEETAVDTQMSLDAAMTRLDTGLGDVRAEVEAVKSTIPAPLAVDLTGINDRLRALSARIDAIAAGASSADAGALAANLSDLEAALDVVRGELSAVSGKANTASTDVAKLAADVAALKTTTAPRPGPSINEVAINGLEAAFAAGRSYADELEALTSNGSSVTIPDAIADAERRGLPDPDVVVNRFAAIVPDMLAAQRPPENATWDQAAADWLGGLLAIRPAGEVEGDTPEAVLARLEAAMERRDFISADPLFTKLPEEMKAAAGELPADVKLLAEAAAFIATLRGAEVAQ